MPAAKTSEILRLKKLLKIEAALDKVRNVAMRMKKRDDMLTVCKTISKQLEILGLLAIRNVQTAIFYVERGTYMNYEYYAKHNKTIITETSYTNHKVHQEFADQMLKGAGSFISTNIAKEDLPDWITYQKTTNVFIDTFLETANSLTYYWYSLGPVALGISTYQPLSENDTSLFKRFLKVFELSYTRYLDIEKAEAQAREAQIEAALERVRSKTMAMQRSDELADTAAILYSQFRNLGYEPGRITIGIMQEEKQILELWATSGETYEPKQFYKLPFGEPHVLSKCVKAWKAQNKSLVLELSGQPLKEYAEFWKSVSGTEDARSKVNCVFFNFAFFSKGYLGFISFERVPSQTIGLLERFASVFDLTYTRFNDLKIAEAHAIQAEKDLIEIKSAKKKAEDALEELQTTQKQLIQSEKMASLGELTAGIAHEIQNPLNFVNNFSEVTNELIDEMNIELAKGDVEEAKAIAIDIKQNLEKINHHGKRADAIVKGMLQHSRSSTGQKELTDVNDLCEEYLRLAYHGLRAKDKSFNAKFETALDASIEKINIIPQDIGRVILNLINNAFYAVNEKKQTTENFEPTVTISTKKIEKNIQISVKDNGKGIPENTVNKIFQPLFTTKPTGLGTGLGLSLSYDIIKAHNGEIKVQTTQNQGTNFIITLPAD